ncbi:MAG: polysaccharide deacetylase family protein [Bacteroidales bacterium]|nr:polysaccharide deacetylase family protein [Bacteroidales bacterium]
MFVYLIIIIFVFTFSILFLLKRGLFWHIFREKGVVYLTFDDGPQQDLTKKILAILDREQVKATFFCVGENVQRYPEIFEEIKKQGHAVGNHTMKHLNGWHTPFQIYIQDVKNANRLINSKLFRPPHGRIGLRQWWHLKKTFRIVFWTKLSYDWVKTNNPQKCLRLIKSVSKYGGIVVFHDNPKAADNMLEALPIFIQQAKKNGLTFKVLSV